MEVVHLLLNFPHLLLTPIWIKPPPSWQVVPKIDQAQQQEELMGDVHEFHCFTRACRLQPKVLLPQQHPSHIVHRKGTENLSEIHGLP
uniref:Uncharacterized protein n=1 Tax=Arundo donax TaxID=35708 RepID=A0A0A9DEN3_ARUDO